MGYKFAVLQCESTVSAPSYDLIADAKGSVDICLILDHQVQSCPGDYGMLLFLSLSKSMSSYTSNGLS